MVDGYIRESWSPGSNDSSSEAQQQQQSSDVEWQSCYLISTDVRNGLPGFMQYLQGRKRLHYANLIMMMHPVNLC